MKYKIAVLPGDGIGPEVMKEAIKVMDIVSKKCGIQFDCTYADVGGAALDSSGEPLPAKTLKLCEESDAILFGSVGGPKWADVAPEKQPERGALLPLRKHFKLFANIRPAVLMKEMANISPLKTSVIKDGIDFVILRELTGGLYFGQPKEKDHDHALDTLIYTRKEVERIVRLAFETAQTRRKKLLSVDKANVLTSMVFWREIVEELKKEYPDVQVEHMYVDNAAIQLVKNPSAFDVIVTENMFGDILSDEAGAIVGSLGMIPSASLNEEGFGLYEPAGGSAPDIAGKGIANPIAQIYSFGMMMKYSFKNEDVYQKIDKAVKAVLANGYRTADIYEEGFKKVSTSEVGDLIAKELEKLF